MRGGPQVPNLTDAIKLATSREFAPDFFFCSLHAQLLSVGVAVAASSRDVSVPTEEMLSLALALSLAVLSVCLSLPPSLFLWASLALSLSLLLTLPSEFYVNFFFLQGRSGDMENDRGTCRLGRRCCLRASLRGRTLMAK